MDCYKQENKINYKTYGHIEKSIGKGSMKMDKKIKKANIIIYLQSLLQFQGFIGPVIFIFYTRYMGLSISQYLLCDSLLFVIMAICEIPSGVIADYIGRKKMLVISSFAICFGMVILLTIPNYIGAIIVAVIYGVFGALQSGVSQSILYETYESCNSIKQYEYTQSKASSVGFIISIVYAIISGYMVEYNLALPVLLDLAICILSILASVLLLEDNRNYSKKESMVLPNKKDIHNVIYVIVVVSILSSCSRLMFSFYQPILTEAIFPIFFLGYTSGSYSLITAGASFFYKRIRERLSTEKMYLLIIALQFLTTIGIVFVNGYFVIAFIFLQQIQRGLMGPFLYMQVNRYIDTNNKNRVSLMSMMYCGISIFTGISLYITSAITNSSGLQRAVFYYVTVINAILILALIIFVGKEKTNQLMKYDSER